MRFIQPVDHSRPPQATAATPVPPNPNQHSLEPLLDVSYKQYGETRGNFMLPC